MLVQCTSRDFVHILAISDRRLFRSVLIPLFFSKDGLNLLVKILTTMAHEQNLEGLFNRDAPLEVLIVHQERHQVVELTGLEVARIRDATLVHSLEFLLADETVQVIIDLPNDELDVGACRSASEELERASDVHRANLIVIVLLGSVAAAQKLEHSIQLLLLNGLNFNRLEDLSWTRLQFFHLISVMFKFF